MLTNRLQKISKEVLRLASQKIMMLNASTIITLTDVKVATKCQSAKIFFIPFYGKTIEDCNNFLTKNLYIIKKYIISEIKLRYALKIDFVFDKSAVEAIKIENILNKIEYITTPENLQNA